MQIFDQKKFYLFLFCPQPFVDYNLHNNPVPLCTVFHHFTNKPPPISDADICRVVLAQNSWMCFYFFRPLNSRDGPYIFISTLLSFVCLPLTRSRRRTGRRTCIYINCPCLLSKRSPTISVVESVPTAAVCTLLGN